MLLPLILGSPKLNPEPTEAFGRKVIIRYCQTSAVTSLWSYWILAESSVLFGSWYDVCMFLLSRVRHVLSPRRLPRYEGLQLTTAMSQCSVLVCCGVSFHPRKAQMESVHGGFLHGKFVLPCFILPGLFSWMCTFTLMSKSHLIFF